MDLGARTAVSRSDLQRMARCGVALALGAFFLLLTGVLVRERGHFDAYRQGDAMAVEVRPGFFGLAWIVALTKD